MDELTDFEKLIQCTSQLAALIYAYYEALKESGFSNDEAILLTIEYQAIILGMAKPKE